MKSRRVPVKSLQVILCIVFALIGGRVVASDITMTPVQLIEQMLTNDESSAMARLSLENARIEYERNAASHAMGGSVHTLRSAEIAWLKAQDNHRIQIADRVIGLAREIMDLDRLQMEVEINALQRELAEITYERTKQRRVAEIASDAELINAELALAEATLAYEAAISEAERAKRSLARQLGVVDFHIDPSLKYHPFSVSINETLDVITEDHLDVMDGEHALVMAEMELARLKLEGAPALNVRVAENELQLAELRLAATKERIELNAEAIVQTVDRTARQYEIALKRTEIERGRHDSVKQQVDAGFIVEDSILSAEIALLQSERALLDALRDYVAACLEYEKLIGADLTASVMLQGGS